MRPYRRIERSTSLDGAQYESTRLAHASRRYWRRRNLGWRLICKAFPGVLPAHVCFADAETHSADVIGGSGTRTYIIELKGKDWKPSTG